ncbi:hypothetical protein GOV03_02335 [Candidatus Woesearchaeota archaeon]|nr:hypothetical protein [Candidatus Woesearchaeota archaeon]
MKTETLEIKSKEGPGMRTIEITQLNIGPADIAKLLHPLKDGTHTLCLGDLIKRAEEEFQMGENEARSVMGYLEVAEYIGPNEGYSNHDMIRVTSKGRELIQQYL